MSAVLIAALALVAIAAATYPLFKLDPRPKSASGVDPALENLLSQREATYSAIKELEFDHAQGKISQSDYADLRGKYEAKALGILRELESFRKPVPKPDAQPLHLPNYGCPQCGEPFEASAKFCRKCGGPLGQMCRTCGTAIDDDDKFCARCGAPSAAFQPA